MLFLSLAKYSLRETKRARKLRVKDGWERIGTSHFYKLLIQGNIFILSSRVFWNFKEKQKCLCGFFRGFNLFIPV